MSAILLPPLPGVHLLPQDGMELWSRGWGLVPSSLLFPDLCSSLLQQKQKC